MFSGGTKLFSHGQPNVFVAEWYGLVPPGATYKAAETLSDRFWFVDVFYTLLFLFLGKSVGGNSIQTDDRLSEPKGK
jgi:hypothetical protein